MASPAKPPNTPPPSMTETAMRYWLGVDTGGTFTDFVLREPGGTRIHKVLSTPQAPEQAILQGIRELGLAGAMAAGKLMIVHGTTVATNAALEGRGADTLFITNSGIEDLLLIGRQARRELYNLTPASDAGALKRSDMLGVDCRRDARGHLVKALDEGELQRLKKEVDQRAPAAVAICLLYSWLDDSEERSIARALAKPGRLVCHSARVLPVSGEYERGLCTWLNAWLGPMVAEYLAHLDQAIRPSTLTVMQSHGGTLPPSAAAEQSVGLLLSGPAGGLCAARAIAAQSGKSTMMTFDMGGTSTDVALLDGELRLTMEGRIGRWPVAVPMVDMHTIGAGGGSLAQVDDAGMLHVGPQSAGASPGPACYGCGGTRATVTDANLVLGRLPAGQKLGGSLELDENAAGRALDELARQLDMDRLSAAEGVIALANEHMAQALRVISVQKGHDPADFTLVSFGGAGGLHVCELARILNMHQALVPANSGVLSAEGLVRAPRQRELVRALPDESDAQTTSAIIRQLEGEGRQALIADGCAPDSIDCRREVALSYQGQSFQLTVPWRGRMDTAEADFHALHEQRYGHQLQLPVSWVHARIQVRAESSPPEGDRLPARTGQPREKTRVHGCDQPVPVYRREDLGAGQIIRGPALICEAVATTWLAPDWQLEVGAEGHLWLQATNRHPG